jgi:hypothetical protein
MAQRVARLNTYAVTALSPYRNANTERITNESNTTRLGCACHNPNATNNRWTVLVIRSSMVDG